MRYHGRVRVLIFGTFDGLHPGHRFLCDTARARGSLHVVVARDVNVRALKGRSPRQSEEERVAALRAAYPDAVVVLGDAADFLQPVRSIDPHLILLGYDQRLPPGVAMEQLPCPVERADAFEPQIYKSSLLRHTDA